MSADPEAQRASMLENWERAAPGWGRRGAGLREWGMPVAAWLVEQLGLQPGQRVLELAAGPGDVGFLAAELVKPGGRLVCSDGAEAMLEVARGRAADQGIDNVEFKRLELEWIDLPTASVDAIVCRWGLMLCVDPSAALSEMRRVLAPGGHLALAVWDTPDLNPWATVPGRALIELGHSKPPDPDEPGMFALAAPGRLSDLLESAGFVDVRIESVELERSSPGGVDQFIAESLDISRLFGDVWERLSDQERDAVRERIAAGAEPFIGSDGALTFPGRSLAASAAA